MVLLGKACSLNLAIAFGKGLLLFWASRSCSGTACCNSEPSKQTYSDRDAFTGSDREMSKKLTELQRFWEKNASQQLQFFFLKKKGYPNFVLPQKRTLQTIHEFQNNLKKNATIATLATNQELTLYGKSLLVIILESLVNVWLVLWKYLEHGFYDFPYNYWE